ncbi:uncharacterized protein LOC130994745 isoform X4 [Salvia miltiorrhiza]|uniref:uncharacterized protein LOC130994745 isoform X4 n=1 Tax=Salvia miltiorrhiza TaxID=226208 RepID=UPI0025AD8DAA|nr:uncharacterized protein LOC130994745 isoform X4 [Salvia miltiorrhiza]
MLMMIMGPPRLTKLTTVFLLHLKQKMLLTDNGPSSFNKVDAISEKTNDSAWLPNGWTVEERTRKSGSAYGSSYKVYTESSTEKKLYSKASVIRYLNDVAHIDIMTQQNKSDNVDEPLPDKSLQISPMTNTGSISGKKRKANSLAKVSAVPEKSPQITSTTSTHGTHEQGMEGNSVVKIDNVGEPFSDTSPQVRSTTNNGGIRKTKRKISSFVTVAIERTAADDLPDGWIKEIRTSKSGDKIRKDPYYTDPASGFMFRSKPDALRYLQTKDIGSCACKPLKMELDDIKPIEERNHSSTPAMHERRPFLGEESNGAESLGMKSPAGSDTKTLKQQQAGQDSVEVIAVGAHYRGDEVSCENSNKSAKMGNNPEPESDVSINAVRVIAVDAATSSPVADPSRNKAGSRKSKKRRELSTPLRTSKRLAGSEPETQPNFGLNERSLRASLRGSTAKEVDASPIVPLEASDIPQTSNIEPAKEVVEHAVTGEETHQDVTQPKEDEKPPPAEGSTVPEEQSGGTETASMNPLVDDQQSQASQLCYDFGDSWSDPLEFALKTLRGELPIEDTLTFPSCFRDPLDTAFSQSDGCLKQPQFDAPINFQSEFASPSESSKKQNAVDPPPAAPPSFSALGNLGFSSFGGFNFQPSAEVGKKDSKTNFNP